MAGNVIFDERPLTLAGTGVSTVSVDLTKIPAGHTTSELIFVLDGTLNNTTSVVAAPWDPEIISDLLTNINISYGPANARQTLQLSGIELEQYKRQLDYRREEATVPVPALGAAVDLFHGIRVPLFGACVGVKNAYGKSTAPASARHPSILFYMNPQCQLTFSGAGLGAAFVSFTGNIRAFADCEPQIGEDGTDPKVMYLVSNSDQNTGNILTFDRADVLILGNEAGAYTALQVDEVISPPLTPEEIYRLRESWYTQGFRFDTALAAVTSILSQPGLGACPRIVANAATTMNTLKVFDRRSEKRYGKQGVRVQLQGRNNAIAVRSIVEYTLNPDSSIMGELKG